MKLFVAMHKIATNEIHCSWHTQQENALKKIIATDKIIARKAQYEYNSQQITK